jgi:hypothetical protein
MATPRKKADSGVAVQAALRWSWSLSQQIPRIRDAEQAAVQSQLDSTRNHIYTHEQQQPFHVLNTEIHLVLVAAHHLSTALGMLGLSGLAEPNLDLVRLLRNIQEHWDEAEGPSMNTYLGQFPNGRPSAYSWGAGGSNIGGLPLDDVESWARRAYDKLTTA